MLINDECDCLPEEYIMRRWRRDLIPPQWLPARARYGEMNVEQERVMGNGFVYVERIYLEEFGTSKLCLISLWSSCGFGMRI